MSLPISWRLSKLNSAVQSCCHPALRVGLRNSVVSPSSSWRLSELNSAIQSFRHPAAGASPSWTPQFSLVAIQQLIPLLVELRCSVVSPSSSWCHSELNSAVSPSSSWRLSELNSAIQTCRHPAAGATPS